MFLICMTNRIIVNFMRTHFLFLDYQFKILFNEEELKKLVKKVIKI